MDAARVVAAVAAAPPSPVRLSYGTAGFRAKAELLDAVFVKMGLLAALRSAHTKQAVGVMVTASHNPIEDNGVKMIDPDGGMLARAWEEYACQLADAATGDAVVGVLSSIAAKEGIALPPAATPVVHVACDTRPSSAGLVARVTAGAIALGASVVDQGLLSTPMLHHIVRMTNIGGATAEAYASEAGYYRMMAEAYAEVLGGVAPPAAAAAPVPGADWKAAVASAAAALPVTMTTGRGALLIDGAHGVGGPKARKLAEALAPLVTLTVRNAGDTAAEAALLNEGVGAEHVQKGRLPPAGFTAAGDGGHRIASLDGDADRVVYHYFDEEVTTTSGTGSSSGGGAWHLLDGDKIAALAAAFLSDQLATLGLPVTGTPTHGHHHGDDQAATGTAAAAASSSSAAAAVATTTAPVSVGVVQTAYANGASSRYIRDTLGLPVPMAKTGVKFVHHAATAYDIGVYFEANGHGTVLFHPSFLARLAALDPAALAPPAATARARLLAASRLINQAIGDALSDALFVEAVLALKGWTVQQWDGIYTDLPSRQNKLAVKDRTIIRTTDDETRVVEPAALQAAIDAAVAPVPSGRAFVRPSGTEDVVRVYAEAATQDQADALAAAAADAAFRLAGGV